MVVVASCVLFAQTLLAFEVEGDGPVRFGVPLPAAQVTKGLRIEASPGARLQWSLLQEEPGVRATRLWVEIAVIGARGRVRVLAGGAGPTPHDAETGAVFGRVATREQDDVRETTAVVWRFANGEEDRRTRTVWLASPPDGAAVAPGQARTVLSPGWVDRATRARISASTWRKLGELPPDRGLARDMRADLVAIVDALPRAPGADGAGDYVRGERGEVVTNLEYDTTFGFARMALATGSDALWQRAYASARHSIDTDLESRSGLPFRHGRHHRDRRPELGHCWLRGLLLVGCRFADRELIEYALAIGRSVAQRGRAREVPEGLADRMRDEAWPLYELEALLRFTDLAPLREGADRLAQRILRRWDPALQVARYGEGESTGAAYKDRCWVTVGILLPGLRGYVERTGDARAGDFVAATERRIVAMLRRGRAGIPLRYWVTPTETFGVLRRSACAEAFLLLDGLSSRARERVLGRGTVRSALDGALATTHDDLATRFSLIARCDWIAQ